MRRVLIIAAAIAPLVAGCASNSKVRAPDTARARPPSRRRRRPTACPRRRIDRWWELYGDEQLKQLVEQALTGSFDQEIALARLEQAYFQRRVTNAALLPRGRPLGDGRARSQTDILSGRDRPRRSELPASPGRRTTSCRPPSTSAGRSTCSAARAPAAGIANADFRTAQLHLRGDAHGARRQRGRRPVPGARPGHPARRRRGDAAHQPGAGARSSGIRVEHGLAASSDLDQAVANTGQTAGDRREPDLAAAPPRGARCCCWSAAGVDPLATLPVPASVGTPPVHARGHPEPAARAAPGREAGASGRWPPSSSATSCPSWRCSRS